MVEIQKVTKEYPRKRAVDDVSLSIPCGEFFGLLGPNGAGKTTLVRMISSLTPPTTGSVRVDGTEVGRSVKEVKAKIGVVQQSENLDWDITARENMLLHGRLFGMHGKKLHERVDELMRFTELYERKDDSVRAYSGGMKRKLMIARALIHQPKLLLLDEPTIGLDPAIRRKVWGLLQHLNKDGMTVLLTTHYIEEAQMLCDRVGFMHEGRIIELDTPQRLIEKFGKVVLEYFEDGEMQVLFFDDRDQALKKAAELHTDVNVRASNLEDAYLKRTNRKVAQQ